jgi:two-component system alkaline phosphatase synthesis response regulator PhoP
MSSDKDNSANILNFFKKRGYTIYLTGNANEGILKARDCFPDLIICQNRMEEKSGLQVYNTLYNDLVKRNTPFFLYLPEYNKEDVVVGLEMGVDSFIISPFDEGTLTKKVNHHLNKSRNSKIIETDEFKPLFETTPVAKFISEQDKIIRTNKAFEKLTGISNRAGKISKIEDIFDFNSEERNTIDLHKCLNGLKDYCLFNAIPLLIKKSVKVDIHLVYTDYLGNGLFMAEVVPSNGENTVNGNEVENTEVSNQHFGSEYSDRIKLTPREKEVLEWSAQGLPIKQIATILKISDRTVEKHRANIMAKTETTSMVEAIYAIRRKMEE